MSYERKMLWVFVITIWLPAFIVLAYVVVSVLFPWNKAGQ